MTMRYIINASIASIGEHFHTEHISGVQGTAIFRDVSDGWFISLRESRTAIYVGKEKPDLQIDDMIRISIEKVEQE